MRKQMNNISRITHHASRTGFLIGLLGLAMVATATAADKKPVLLYTQYFNAEGENRYSPDTTYKDVVQKLRDQFEVRVSSDPLTARSLSGVNLVLIANPSDKAVVEHPAPHHFASKDIDVISRWVDLGGRRIIKKKK